MNVARPTIQRLLAAAAERVDGSAALLAPGREALSHRQLTDLIARTVEDLNRLGIGRGDRVAMVLPNGPEMATAFLAVAATATAAPLNPAYPAAEFDFYLGDLKPRAVMVDAGQASPAREVARARGIPLIELTPQRDAEAGRFVLMGESNSSAARSRPAQPDDVALVLHTSGTTSRPKLVPITQAQMCASATNIAATLQLTRRDRALNVLPLFHVYGLVATVLAPLSAGGSLVCTPGFDVAQFFPWLEEFQPTWYAAGPTMHQAILARAKSLPDLARRCRLRFIRSASAALPPQVMAELEHLFEAPVIEAYGMTEAASMIASNPLPPRMRKPGSVGLAAGPEIAIVDEAGRLLSAGERGEVVIRGENVMRGYDGDVAANAEAFTNGWLRTGDEGYLDADRYLFITGRLKEMINRGGEKISPREIDEVLLDHPAIAQAVTFALPHATLGEDVAAAVVLHETRVASEREIQQFVGARLSHFKVPRRVVILDEIPTGPTGKPQRIGLAARLRLTDAAALGSAVHSECVPPQTPVERELVRMWEDVLKITPISVDDNFFDLGGDSLEAMVFINRLQDELNAYFYVTGVFDAPTVAQFAEYLRANYRESLIERFGSNAGGQDEATPTKTAAGQAGVNAEKVALVQRRIAETRCWADCPNIDEQVPSAISRVPRKNRRAIFVLSPPRSGSTLLRVMLAGHPQLFAPPELCLLAFDTLQQWNSTLVGRFSARREGLLKAVMTVLGCDQQEAERRLQAADSAGDTVAQFYDQLQDWIAPRILIDKTPSYVFNLETLRRAELLFDEPVYIHLTRHPIGSVLSFEEIHIEQALISRPESLTPRELAECLWLISHRNILTAFADVPAHRQIQVRFEDLVKEPALTMERLCRFLGLPLHPDLLRPYDDHSRRMTDGIHAESAMMGDPKFHTHRDIDPQVADRWKQASIDHVLYEGTSQMAERLGYATESARIGKAA